jgi:hypothetical protein
MMLLPKAIYVGESIRPDCPKIYRKKVSNQLTGWEGK